MPEGARPPAMSGGEGRGDADPLLAAGHEARPPHFGARPFASARRATVAVCFACAAVGVATAVLCTRPYDARRAQPGSARRGGSAQWARESWLDELQVKAYEPYLRTKETPADCGPVFRDYTVYTEQHVDILDTDEVKSWADCCSRCGNESTCNVWSYSTAAETNGLQDGCYLKSVSSPDPDSTSKCPTFLNIPGIYSGTSMVAIKNKNINLDLSHCTPTSTSTTTTAQPTTPALIVDIPQVSYTDTTTTVEPTTTSTTRPTNATLLGSPSGNATSPLGSVSEWLHPPKLLWLLLAMLILLLLCLACALALANTGHKKSSRSASISSPKKEEDRQSSGSWMPAPTEIVAQGPMIPVTQRLPEPPANLEDTYAKGFIDGMVQWVRENNPSSQYTPAVQPGARTVAGLPTATGVQQAAGMGSWQQGSLQQGSLQQGGLQQGGLQQAQQTASLSPAAGSFQSQQASSLSPGAGSFPAQPSAGSFPAQAQPGAGSFPTQRSFQQFPFPQAPGAANFSLPQPEPGSFVAATHR